MNSKVGFVNCFFGDFFAAWHKATGLVHHWNEKTVSKPTT